MKANKKVSVTCIKNNIYVNIHNIKCMNVSHVLEQ